MQRWERAPRTAQEINTTDRSAAVRNAYRALLVLAADGKGVLEDGIDDATDTKRRLNDTGGDVLARDLHVVLNEFYEASLERVLLAVDVNHCLAAQSRLSKVRDKAMKV